jgi:phage minor structural protein
MILYFADRHMNILGQASTELPEGLYITDDQKTEEVEAGVATLEFTLNYTGDTRKDATQYSAVGNYILRKNGDEQEFYTIITSEENIFKQEIEIYAEDAGMDLLNETVGEYKADKAYPASYYVKKFSDDSGFGVGINEVSNYNRKLSWEGEATASERILSVATQFDAEVSYTFEIERLKIKHKYINLHKKRGVDQGRELRINREVKNIIVKSSVEDLATALSVTGGYPEESETPITLKGYKYDDGDIYLSGSTIYSRSAVAKWSRYLSEKGNGSGHIVQTYTYDTLSQSELCNRAVSKLKKIYDAAVSYEVELAYLPDGIKIGDTVNIVDDAGELYLSARIMKLESSICNDEYTATLGEYKLKSSGISEKMESLASQFEKLAKNRTFYTWVVFADTETGGGISLKSAGKTYMGIAYNQTTKQPVLTDPSIYIWVKVVGEQGIAGEPGKNGLTSFFHVRYADVPNPTANQLRKDTGKYIGTYVDFTQTDSNDPKKYSWQQLEGSQGPQGKQGISGTNGVDGKTSYLHIKYSNDGGKTFTGNSGEDIGSYIGTCVDYAKDDPTSVGAYKWAKIKGETGAKGDKGDTGKGVKSTAVTYQVSSSGTAIPTGTWSSSVPSASAGQYLWTRTVITYTDNTTSTIYSVSRMGTNGTNGANGKSIGSVINYYLATASASGVTAATSGWTTTVQSVSAAKKYLWNYEVVKYTDGTVASTTAPCIIGSYGDQGSKGDKGDTGSTGNGIKSITEHYAVSTSNSTVPTSWSSTVPTMTESNKYLWNYETITYTNGTTVDTTKRVIGVYGNKGATGATGSQGYSLVANVVRDAFTESQWATYGTINHEETWSSTSGIRNGCRIGDMFAIVGTATDTKNAHVAYYRSNTASGDLKGLCISHTIIPRGATGATGSKGDKGDTGATGKGVKSTAVTYQASSSGTTIPTGVWSATPPATSADKPYFWTRTIITYTDNTTSTAYNVGSTPEGIVVGGRNLLQKTSDEWSDYWKPASGTNVCVDIKSFAIPDNCSVGDIFTTAIEIEWTGFKSSSAGTFALWSQGSQDGTWTHDNPFANGLFKITSESGKQICTLTKKWDGSCKKYMISMRCDYSSGAGKIRWRRLKIEKGNMATDWTPAPEDYVSFVDVEYYLSTSATSLSGGSWSTTAPTWVNGKYMWSRTVTTDGAGNKTYSPNQNGVCIAGAQGATGVKGDKGDKGETGATGGTGATGNGVKSIVEQYYKSTSATSLSGGSWSTTYPGWENGKYIWTRSVITYTNNTTSTTTPVCVTGTKGDKGDKGDKGATGPQGPQGPQGVKGDKGPQGDKGATGATGPQGPQGAAGKDANQVVHTVNGNGESNLYVEFATIKITGLYANHPTTFKLGGRGFETTDVQFSFISANNSDPGLDFLRSSGGWSLWIYKKTTSTWGLITRLNEPYGHMRVFNYTQGSGPYTVTWTSTKLASLPSGSINANPLQAAKTATNFMQFTDGTGLEVGNKTSGSWSGYRTKISASAFEILNQAGTTLAYYGDKLIQLGKNAKDAVIELCGGVGKILVETKSGNAALSIQSEYVDIKGVHESVLETSSSSGSCIAGAVDDSFVVNTYSDANNRANFDIGNGSIILESKKKGYQAEVEFYGCGWSGGVYTGAFAPTKAYSEKIMLGDSGRVWERLIVKNSPQVTSDRRAKTNIFPLGESKINKTDIHSELFDRLKPVQYRMIDGDGRICYGFVAQDVVEAMRELGIREDELDLVHHDRKNTEDGYIDTYSMVYTNLIAVITHELQLEKERRSKLELEVVGLRSELDTMRDNLSGNN